MTPRRILIAAALAIVVGLLVWWLWGRGDGERMLSGYIEGDALFLSTPVAGTVTSVPVAEGQRVKAGERLFTIDPATLSAQGEQAGAVEAQARTSVASAQAVAQQAEAEVAAAAATARRARQDLDRYLATARADSEAVAGRELDQARTLLREAEARLAAARETAAARRAQVAAARAQVAQARGGVREVQIRVDQLAPAAPAAGRVQDVFYRPGEWVAANQPIVSLLPDDRVKVRFFVPQAEVARYRIGTEVTFSCDGCGDPIRARISFVSARPEFTPPVIYSREARDRMVFMAEAIPAAGARLMPGLPVDVRPLGDAE